jgi:hypothetical protein
MVAILRCKMRVQTVTHTLNSDGSTESERVELGAVSSGSDENKQFSKWTPCANFNITINNPGAFNKLSKGFEFYVDFTPTTPPTNV